MKKLILMLIGIMCLGACSSLPQAQYSIVGKWSGTDPDGTTASLIFNKDKSAEMIFKGATYNGESVGGSVNWSLNTNYNPMHLDLVMSIEAEVDVVVPMIVRFHDDNTLEVRMTDDMESRPERFSEVDGINQTILNRY